MHESSRVVSAPSPAIEGHNRPRRDRFVPRKFSAVARLLWRKPAAHIAALIHRDERTGKRILRGETEVPAVVMVAACQDMLKPAE